MPQPYSHSVQVMLNYYPSTDVRVRTYPYTIDAQLFNVAGVLLDDLDLRYNREVQARYLQTTPVSIDNGGLYLSAPLPNTFIPDTDAAGNPILNLVQGTRNGQTQTLPVYDDRLPAPTRVTLDASRPVVPFTTPQLFTWTSDGRPQYLLTPNLTLPIPSALNFWMEGAQVPGLIDILVTGYAYPMSAWQKNRILTSETVSYTTKEGLATTNTVWAQVASVTVRNVPSGVTISCNHFPFKLPADIDLQRPYTSPAQRDVTFDRYWQISGTWLKEQFHSGPSVELSTVNCYATPDLLNDISIDPWAYTLQAVSGTTLYVMDRRMQMPGQLQATAMTSEPAWSINVQFDETESSSTSRYVTVTPLQHGYPNAVRSYRYIVEDPSGNPLAVDGNGNFYTYAGNAGWLNGDPVSVSIPLRMTGTYVIELQCLDVTGAMTTDGFPFLNPGLNILATLDLTSIVPRSLGIARDSLEQLWIWTGTYAVPIRLHFDAYVFDAASMTVYLTDPFDQIQVS